MSENKSTLVLSKFYVDKYVNRLRVDGCMPMNTGGMEICSQSNNLIEKGGLKAYSQVNSRFKPQFI